MAATVTAAERLLLNSFQREYLIFVKKKKKKSCAYGSVKRNFTSLDSVIMKCSYLVID